MNSATAEKRPAGELMTGFDPAQVTALLQEAGYRVERESEQDGAPVLRSATGGLAFHVGFSNPSTDAKGLFLTARFFAALQVQGELPLSIINGWNTSMRFGRLYLGGSLLVLDMDVLAAGGMPPAQLVAHVQVWDRLLQGLIAYLRDVLPKAAANAPGVAAERPAAAAG